uniref:Ig-like domain-containing protein n=1 Tax=Anopheles culicifacies TaxID=139723 RepID=A0A182M9M6_9DIPT
MEQAGKPLSLALSEFSVTFQTHQRDDTYDRNAFPLVQPCLQSPQPPQYVYWQRNDRMINYDDSRRDITIETTPGPRTQSRLIIREPQINDSGNYTCSASNTEPASIYVFVSKGK